MIKISEIRLNETKVLFIVHFVFQTYLEQNSEHLCKTTKFKNIFTTRRLELVAKLESETNFKKIYEIFFLKKKCC